MAAAGATVTATLPDAEPPEPVHVTVYVVEESGTTVIEPFGNRPAPPAFEEHELAFVDDQVRVTDCPGVTLVGLAEIAAVGAEAAAVNIAVTLLFAVMETMQVAFVPPVPVAQESPDQPVKVEPELGVATSIGAKLATNEDEQEEPQLIWEG